MMIALPLAFITSVLVAGLVRHARILDHPNERSSHSTPTPRAGGLGILAGFAFGLAGVAIPTGESALALLVILGAASIGGLIGLLDDLFTLSEKPRFLAMVILSFALSALVGPVTDLGYMVPWGVGLAGSALWVFTTANAVNFMDGSDGLMVACLGPASLALALMGEGGVETGSYLLAAALAGFAVWNAPLVRDRGRLFAGDVGSLAAAILFAGLALWWASSAPSGSVWLVPLLVMPLLADVLLTMAARARAGRRLFTAHRAHAYQLLLRMGHSHRRVAFYWGVLSLGFGAIALVGNVGPLWVKSSAFLLGVAIAMILHRIIRDKARAAGLDVTQ
jgi:UDP-N-acetylmuramyl pentapeptide phosphotransferase/UDP-N-acetylglucosamine-1-phosphate transferase